MAEPLPILTTLAPPGADPSVLVSPQAVWEPKLQTLRGLLRSRARWVIAFSGGIDSVLLLAVAARECGEGVVAMTAVSPTLPERERLDCERTARDLGVRLLLVESGEMDVEGFASNPRDRCFFCKTELYRLARAEAVRLGIDAVADGVNADDLGDHRPGLLAAEAAGVVHPFVLAGMDKADIRGAALSLGLPSWNKPAFACLSSRIPYGTRITREGLAMIERVEAELHRLGFRQGRARHHGDVCRIEVPPQEIAAAAEEPMRSLLARAALDAGFAWVALDLHGYRMGSMNTVQPAADGPGPG